MWNLCSLLPAPPVNRSYARRTSRPMAEGDALLRQAHPPGLDREHGAGTPQERVRRQPRGPGVTTQDAARGGRRLWLRDPGHPRGPRRSRGEVRPLPEARAARPAVLGPPGDAGGGRGRLAAGRPAARRVSLACRAVVRLATGPRHRDVGPETATTRQHHPTREAIARCPRRRRVLPESPPGFAREHRDPIRPLTADPRELWAHLPLAAHDRPRLHARIPHVPRTRGPLADAVKVLCLWRGRGSVQAGAARPPWPRTSTSTARIEGSRAMGRQASAAGIARVLPRGELRMGKGRHFTPPKPSRGIRLVHAILTVAQPANTPDRATAIIQQHLATH